VRCWFTSAQRRAGDGSSDLRPNPYISFLAVADNSGRLSLGTMGIYLAQENASILHSPTEIVNLNDQAQASRILSCPPSRDAPRVAAWATQCAFLNVQEQPRHQRLQEQRPGSDELIRPAFAFAFKFASCNNARLTVPTTRRRDGLMSTKDPSHHSSTKDDIPHHYLLDPTGMASLGLCRSISGPVLSYGAPTEYGVRSTEYTFS
jgi:hypothetical protein